MLTLGIVQTSLTSTLAQPHLSQFTNSKILDNYETERETL